MKMRNRPTPAAPAEVQSQAAFSSSPPLDSGRQPLYVVLAQSLMRDIAQQRYPVGSLLPTEDAIATRYGVSRHTVRQALRELKEEGVIASHRGVGTRVRARAEMPRVFGGIHTIRDLLQFAESTEMQVIGRREITADAAFAEQYQCRPGQAWLEVTLLRKLADQKRPLGYIQAYVRPEYAEAVGRDKSYTRPMYSVIEERCGVRVVEVLQEITAANLSGAIAKALKATEGQAAMRITRYFLDRAGAVVEISVGHYPSGLYTQRSRFRAQRSEHEPEYEASAAPIPLAGAQPRVRRA